MDDKKPDAGGEVDGSPISSLPVGGSEILSYGPVFIGTDTTNTATVSGYPAGSNDPNDLCEATDKVDVTVEPEPPEPPLEGKCTGKLKEVVVYWNGTGNIDVTAGAGVVGLSANSVAPNGLLTISTDGATNDVFVNISGSVSGESKFHISCSDNDMDAEDDNDAQEQVSDKGQDCGKFQGDAKSNGDPSFINTWLLEGMLDAEDLRLTCGFDPKTVDNADGPGSPPAGADCSVDGDSKLKLDKKKAEWKLTNTGNEKVTITRVEIDWPDSDSKNKKLKKVKLDGDTIAEPGDSAPPTTITSFMGSVDTRQIKTNDTDTLKFEFEKDVDKDESKYNIIVDFESEGTPGESCQAGFNVQLSATQQSQPVVSTSTSDGGMLNADQLETHLVGNTEVGTYNGGIAYAEYFHPDGRILSVESGYDYTGSYYISKEGSLCSDWEGTSWDNCVFYEWLSGTEYRTHPGGDIVNILEGDQRP